MPDHKARLEDMHALGVKVAGIGLGTVDYIDDTITLDDRAAELFDLPPQTPISRATLHDRIHPEDRMEIDHQVDDLLDPHGEDFIEVIHRVVHGNGKIIWVNARKQVHFAATDGASKMKAVSGLVAIIDVTAHKESEAHIQYLMNEIAHRSKNLLTVVQSIAQRTYASGEPETFTKRFGDRIAGLAHNQDVLVRTNNLHADLHDLVTTQLRAFSDVGSARITAQGPKVRLKPHPAQAIGMALHELATNASKYGALSQKGGKVTIEWVENDEGAELSWIEAGGPKVEKPAKTGFGQTVLRDMAGASLGGNVTLDYHPDGLRWVAHIPKNALVTTVI